MTSVLGASISSIADGQIYILPKLRFGEPRVFSSLAFTHSLVVKRPTKACLEDFHRTFVRGEDTPPGGYPAVRLANNEEKNAEVLLKKFIEFQHAYSMHKEYGHFLMVHRLQYERLVTSKVVQIPQSRFILVRDTQFLFFKKVWPAIVQDRVAGKPLLEMVEEHVDAIISQWIPFLPMINQKLHYLLESDLKNHLNLVY